MFRVGMSVRPINDIRLDGLGPPSVWIRSFAGRKPLRTKVVRRKLIHGELLIGDFGGRKKLLDDYDKLFQAAIVPHRDVVAFVEMRNLSGRGIGWIDVHILASALVSRLKLWTADSRLSAIADQFGVGHRIPD